MRSTHTLILLGAIAVAACSKAAASDDTPRSSSAPTAPVQTQAAHTSRADNDLQWVPAPWPLPVGAEIAVLQGDPGSTQPFTIRLRFPNGYKIPPHTHPTVENVTVLSGTFLAGDGPTFDASQMQALGRDEFVSIPANHAHYAMAQGLTIIQLHAIGPFATTYVNPADTPPAR
jgi:quercetin dioxygenase-like cupin family protein